MEMGIFIHIVGTSFAISIKIPNVPTLYQLILQSRTHKIACWAIQHGIVYKTKDRKDPTCPTTGHCYMNHGTSIQFTITWQRKE